MKTRSIALALAWLAATNLTAASDLAEGSNRTAQLDGHRAFAALVAGTGVVLGHGAFAIEPGSAGSGRALLKSITAWLSAEFGVPLIEEPPAVKFVPAHRIALLRYPSARWDGQNSGSGETQFDRPEVVAVYEDSTRTIYLPEGWSGDTPGEVSLLVHELVHHVQNVAKLKFACPEEREKLAYQAQQRLLGLFGSDLQAEFGLDPFTLLVRSNCPR